MYWLLPLPFSKAMPYIYAIHICILLREAILKILGFHGEGRESLLHMKEPLTALLTLLFCNDVSKQLQKSLQCHSSDFLAYETVL